MTVDARHLNFNGGCHGGAIFALADSAFGLASNSHGPVAVGIDAHITFQAPVRPATCWSPVRPKCSAAGASASTGSRWSSRPRRATAARARLELHRHGLHQGLRACPSRPGPGDRAQPGIDPRGMSRRLSSERQHGVKIFLQSAAACDTHLARSPSLARPRRGSARTRRRCARRSSASGRRSSWRELAALVRALACGLAEAGLQRGQHLVVVGENRPRLYAAMLAAQSLGAVPVPLYQDAAATEYAVPDRQRRGRLRDRRGPGAGRQDARGARRLPRPGARSGSTNRADCAITTRTASPRSTPWSSRGAPTTPPTRASSKTPGRADPAGRRRCDVLHVGYHRQPQGRGPHPCHADRPRRRRRPLRQAHVGRRGAGLPSAGLGRPEHLLLRPVAGVRLRGQLPRVRGNRLDRPQRGRADLLLRAAAGLRRAAHQRDDPHGRRRLGQEVALRSIHGARPARRPRADGRQAGRRLRPPRLRARQPADLRAAAQHARLLPGPRGLHRRRGHRPRPVHVLPLDRHQPEAALRLDRDRRVRLPAARP